MWYVRWRVCYHDTANVENDNGVGRARMEKYCVPCCLSDWQNMYIWCHKWQLMYHIIFRLWQYKIRCFVIAMERSGLSACGNTHCAHLASYGKAKELDAYWVKFSLFSLICANCCFVGSRCGPSRSPTHTQRPHTARASYSSHLSVGRRWWLQNIQITLL